MNATEYNVAKIAAGLAGEMPKTRIVKVFMGLHFWSAALGALILVFAGLASLAGTDSEKGSAFVGCIFVAVIYGLWAWLCFTGYYSVNALRDHSRQLMAERAALQLTQTNQPALPSN